MFTAKDAMYQSMAYTDKKTNDIPKTSTLEDLTDVNVTEPSDGEVLKYDAESEKWVNGEGGGSSQEVYEIEVWDNHEFDVTFAEILQAYQDGKKLVLYMHGESQIGPYSYGDVKLNLTSAEEYYDGVNTTYTFNFATNVYEQNKPVVASLLSVSKDPNSTYPILTYVPQSIPTTAPYVITYTSTWDEINDAFKSGRQIFAWDEHENFLIPVNDYHVDSNLNLSQMWFLYSFIAIDSTDYLSVTQFSILPAYSGGGWRYGSDGFYTRYIPTYADPPES